LPSSPQLFSAPPSLAALERTIALHLIRTGQFAVAQCFVQESGVEIQSELVAQFANLHRILGALRSHDVSQALEWTVANRPFLHSRSSPLEFHLHRSQFMRLLLASSPPDPLPALRYAQSLFPPLFETHGSDIMKLMACTMYLPLSRMKVSPYADLADPSIHFNLETRFAREFCAKLGLSKDLPLRVVGDIGAGGALARIEKGRKLMRERRSEWSQTDELPIEISLAPEHQYHSIFACPVSKEQSNDANPPMMMSCGHVVVKDSLTKLSKPGGRVKCPYCPAESSTSSALQVFF